VKRKVKRRSIRQRRLSRLNAIARRMLASKDVAGLKKLADWMYDYSFEAESDLLNGKVKEWTGVARSSRLDGR